MSLFLLRLVPAAALVAALASSPASAQVFTDGAANLPAGAANAHDTEQIDFADVDLDGDWDTAVANGGDSGNYQNQLWINAGGLQTGSPGTFVDETATRLPFAADSSRDVEFADFDGDGDEDLAIANHSMLVDQSNRLWTNVGGAQQQTLGVYRDETAARYVGVGGAGSSVAAEFVLPGGGFVDWSCDVDFADLDADGDLDLVHSTYGQAHNGNVPTRLFLNDGGGFFTEFNPSGHQLAGQNIANGEPALWAEGRQQHNTTNATGQFADIATDALDVEAADLDGDLDVDLLLGARSTGSPRFFQNRLEETGQLAFRDVTGLALPPAAISGGSKYEQELGDLDRDGDLDLLGLNWAGFNERTYFNQGDGTFAIGQDLASSGADDEEADFLDYDHDGDLDLYVANFSGQDKLYANVTVGPDTLLQFVSTAAAGLDFADSSARDVDVADVDLDGDVDVMIATRNGGKNVLALNQTGTPDTTPPYFGAVSTPAGGPVSIAPRPVRAAVYDNAALYQTRFYDVSLRVAVEGVALPPLPAVWGGGQLFRGEVPGNLVGAIEARVQAVDDGGNTGLSTPVASLGTGWSATEFGAGCAGALGVPTLQALSAPLGGSTLFVAGGHVPPGTPGALVLSSGQQPTPVDLGDGICSNVQSPFVWSVKVADENGHHLLALPVPPGVSGATAYGQYVALAGAGGDAWASSAGLEIVAP